MTDSLGPFALGRVHCADALEALRLLPAASIQCCVTSPPYFGLRDYGVPPILWGGDPNHAHKFGAELPPHHPGQVEQTKWKDAEAAGKGQTVSSGAFCPCGTWRGCLGLEPTPTLYVEHLVAVFREVRRVLRPDGTAWIVIGDSYSGGGCGARDPVCWPKQSRNTHMSKHAKKPIARVDGRYRLRGDLGGDQIAYVLSELAKAWVISSSTQEGRP